MIATGVAGVAFLLLSLMQAPTPAPEAIRLPEPMPKEATPPEAAEKPQPMVMAAIALPPPPAPMATPQAAPAKPAAAPAPQAPVVRVTPLKPQPAPAPEPVKVVEPMKSEPAPTPEPVKLVKPLKVQPEPLSAPEPEPAKVFKPLTVEAKPQPVAPQPEPEPALEPEPVKAIMPLKPETRPEPLPLVDPVARTPGPEPEPTPEPEPIKSFAALKAEARPAPEPEPIKSFAALKAEARPLPEPEPIKSFAPARAAEPRPAEPMERGEEKLVTVSPAATATPEAKEGRTLLRLLEHGSGPVIEIAWPRDGYARTQLHETLRRCYGMQIALMDRAGSLFIAEGPRGQKWAINLDRYSGFVRQPDGFVTSEEDREADAIRRYHGLPSTQAVRIFPRAVDAVLLGGLHSLIGERYRSARSIHATYRQTTSGLFIEDIEADGVPARGRIAFAGASRGGCR